MKSNKDPNLIIIEEALRAAREAAGEPAPNGNEGPRAGRDLEILFYGMMCFDPLPKGAGYRVLFPNGLDLTELTDIPVHSAGLWIRGRDQRVTSRWSGVALRNDFFVSGKQRLTISGLVKTPLDASAFQGRLTNLRECDPEFEISDDPDAVIDMTVDRGTLSAHVVNGAGMIVVKWKVQVEDGAAVRFAFDNDFVEIPATVTQVVLANVSPKPGSESIRHFQLFRKLSTTPDRPLEFKLPKTPPTDFVLVHEPTFGYGHAAPPAAPGPQSSIVGVVPQSILEAVAQTPDVVCSAVVSGTAA